MKSLKNILIISQALILILILSVSAQAQDAYKMNKADKAKLKILLANDWKSLNIVKNGQEIDINKIADVTYMYFSKGKNKDYDFRLKMGQMEKNLKFYVQGDQIIFPKNKDWNPYKIISLDKGKFSFEQMMNGENVRWNMEAIKK